MLIAKGSVVGDFTTNVDRSKIFNSIIEKSSQPPTNFQNIFMQPNPFNNIFNPNKQDLYNPLFTPPPFPMSFANSFKS